MKYAIQINASPCSGNAGLSALRFTEAAIAMGHDILRVFFYHDGIYFAFDSITPPDDELNLSAQWQQLATKHSLDLVVCISAAQRRGLLSCDENARQNRADNLLAPGFRISGLGQLLESILKADRFLVFN